MAEKISPRLLAIIEALPLKPGLRVLEIGCGPGAMAREIARRISGGYVLGIDRSARAIQLAKAGSTTEVKTGRLAFRQIEAADFELLKSEKPFDIAVAVRVGALDGRHPEEEKITRAQIKKALKKSGKLFF